MKNKDWFTDAIKIKSGYKVLKNLPFFSRKRFLLEFKKIMNKVYREMNSVKIKEQITQNSQADNMNQTIGKYAEDVLKDKINKTSRWTAGIPKNSKGKRQTTGYPDLYVSRRRRFRFKRDYIYLEVKTRKQDSQNSTFSSFTMQYSGNNSKIHRSLPHFLISYEKSTKPNKTINSIELYNLYNLTGQLITSFESNNKEIYSLVSIFDK